MRVRKAPSEGKRAPFRLKPSFYAALAYGSLGRSWTVAGLYPASSWVPSESSHIIGRSRIGDQKLRFLITLPEVYGFWRPTPPCSSWATSWSVGRSSARRLRRAVKAACLVPLSSLSAVIDDYGMLVVFIHSFHSLAKATLKLSEWLPHSPRQ